MAMSSIAALDSDINHGSGPAFVIVCMLAAIQFSEMMEFMTRATRLRFVPLEGVPNQGYKIRAPGHIISAKVAAYTHTHTHFGTHAVRSRRK